MRRPTALTRVRVTRNEWEKMANKNQKIIHYRISFPQRARERIYSRYDRHRRDIVCELSNDLGDIVIYDD